MRLALASGRLDVDQVLAGLSAADLREWAAFEALEGSLGARGDWEQHAELMALLAEVHRNATKRSRPFKPSEFLPWLERAVLSPARTLRAQLGHLLQKKKE